MTSRLPIQAYASDEYDEARANRYKKKAPAATGAINTETPRKRNESMNTSLDKTAANYTTEALTKWWAGTAAAYEKHAFPIETLDDVRVEFMLSSTAQARSRHLLGKKSLAEIIEYDPEAAGQLYFNKYVVKSEPPIATPGWAVSREVLWGSFPEVEMMFRSESFNAGSFTFCWEQFVSIQGEDDDTRELLSTPVVHVSPPGLLLHDGNRTYGLGCNIDDLLLMGAAVEDAAQLMARTESSARELCRRTEPGAPSFEETI